MSLVAGLVSVTPAERRLSVCQLRRGCSHPVSGMPAQEGVLRVFVSGAAAAAARMFNI